MCGRAMAHMYQRNTALAEEDSVQGGLQNFAASPGLGFAAAAASPAPMSRFSYANRQQVDMRRKAREWFSAP